LRPPFGGYVYRYGIRDRAVSLDAAWLLADPSRHHGRRFWLLFGVRYEQDIYYREEFEHSHSSTPILISANAQPGRARMDGTAALCAAHLAWSCRRSERYARVHLRLDKMVSGIVIC